MKFKKQNPTDAIVKSVERYDFGTEYRGNTGVPAIVRKVDGRYVRYDDYVALATHNELLSLQLQRLSKASQVDDPVGIIRADDQPGGDTWAEIWEDLPVGTYLYAVSAVAQTILNSPKVQSWQKDASRLDKLERDYFQPMEGGIRKAIDEQIAIDAFMEKLK